MRHTNIGFIGGGNMARSLIGGLVATTDSPAMIYVSEPEEDKRRYFQDTYGAKVSGDNGSRDDSW